MDQAVADAGVRDAQAAGVRGFPYLRVNRLLASYRNEALDPGALAQWASLMRGLDREARLVELANLPSAQRQSLAQHLAAGKTAAQMIDSCGQELWEADRGRPERMAQLRERAVVPDEYRTSWRVMGLYPLTSLFVNMGTTRLHNRTREVFALSLEDLPVEGTLVRYAPPESNILSPAQVSDLLTRAARNPLAVPAPDEPGLEALFAAFAPVWEIDTLGDADRIGRPAWSDAPVPRVVTDEAVVYRLLSHTRYDGRVLLQLNYVIWFPQRPLSGPFDLLGGHMDGITWRVTLDTDGRPLLYDTVHNCGCYQMSFTSPGLRLIPDALRQYGEPPLVAQQAPVLTGRQRMVIRISTGRHYLQKIYADAPENQEPATSITYLPADYRALRSLPVANGGRRSLFGEDGIVPGTRRAERWLIWPMGVPAPGAMRQWGHHAIAFVGRRHLDDADVIARYFEPVKASPKNKDGEQ